MSEPVSFQRLLRSLAHSCGLNPDELGLTEGAALAEHLTAAAEEAWRYSDWPDIVKTEQRSLRPLFSFAETYTYGTEVYDPITDAYYVANGDGFAGVPVTDEAFWTEATTLDRQINLSNSGDTPIGEVLGLFNADPESGTDVASLGFRLMSGNVQLETGAANIVWVRFRTPPPQFTTELWSAGTAYEGGDVVYLAPHCYVARTTASGSTQSPLTDSTRWLVQTVPELLARSIRYAARAEWLASEGQTEKSLSDVTRAEDALADASMMIGYQQSQTRRYSVATRSASTRLYGPRRLLR